MDACISQSAPQQLIFATTPDSTVVNELSREVRAVMNSPQTQSLEGNALEAPDRSIQLTAAENPTSFPATTPSHNPSYSPQAALAEIDTAPTPANIQDPSIIATSAVSGKDETLSPQTVSAKDSISPTTNGAVVLDTSAELSAGTNTQKLDNFDQSVELQGNEDQMQLQNAVQGTEANVSGSATVPDYLGPLGFWGPGNAGLPLGLQEQSGLVPNMGVSMAEIAIPQVAPVLPDFLLVPDPLIGTLGSYPMNDIPANDAMHCGINDRTDTVDYIDDVFAPRIKAYAKLQFEDGFEYINTWQCYLGRDKKMAKEVSQRKKAEAELEKQPHTPVRNHRSKHARSVVSETSGILRDFEATEAKNRKKTIKRTIGSGAGLDGASALFARKKSSKKSKSTSSSSQLDRKKSLARAEEFPMEEDETLITVDPGSLMPSPHDCPLIGIHPPSQNEAALKVVSRLHMMIRYNHEKNYFEAEILGRNGAFIQEVFHSLGSIVELHHGSLINIGGVQITFLLPNPPEGQEGGAEKLADAESPVFPSHHSESGKEMSLGFGTSPRGNLIESPGSIESLAENSSDEEDDESGREQSARAESQRNSDDEDAQFDSEPDERESDGEDQHQTVLKSVETEDHSFNGSETRRVSDALLDDKSPASGPGKKRGPGRPPKNGVMSKREQQLAKKLAQEQEKAKAKQTESQPQNDATQPPNKEKKKVGRPRIHPRAESPGVPREKRKYTKRKPKEPKDPNSKESGDDEDKPAKQKKEKKPKPPRSPTPKWDEATLTNEQKQRPPQNYLQLIAEVLAEAPAGKMALPQIYRAIQRKYPYFTLPGLSAGWQSSVRHNLQQHSAFYKVDREGKGFSWALKPGVSIEKDRKPKRTSPPSHMNNAPILYQAGYPQEYQQQYPPGHMGPPAPGYQYPPGQYQGQPGYMPQPQMNGQPGPYPGVHPVSQFGQLPAALVAAPAAASTYNSPYAPKAPPSAPPPPPQSVQHPGSIPYPNQAVQHPGSLHPPMQQPGPLPPQPVQHPGLLPPQPVHHPGNIPPTHQTMHYPESTHPSSQAVQYPGPLHPGSIPPPPQAVHQSAPLPPDSVPPSQQTVGQPGSLPLSQGVPNPGLTSPRQTFQHAMSLPQSQAAQRPGSLPPQQHALVENPPEHGMNDDDDEFMSGFINRFKPHMENSLAGKHENPAKVVESALDRLFGRTKESALPGDAHEESIFQVMKNTLTSIPRFKTIIERHSTLQGTSNEEKTAPLDNATLQPAQSFASAVSGIAELTHQGQGKNGEILTAVSNDLLGTLMEPASLQSTSMMTPHAGQKRLHESAEDDEERAAKRAMIDHQSRPIPDASLALVSNGS